MVFPWISFLKEGGKKRLSDIEYLAIKEFDGKLRNAKGANRTTTGDLATLTANSGKDMYLAVAKASCDFSGNGSATLVLKVNGTIEGTWRVETMTNATLENPHYEFALKGVKVAATQIIKLEVTVADVDLAISGELVCFEETTGESPQI